MSEPASDRPVRPRRSVLYVPASNARAMAKAPTLGADAIIFDLEDAVAPEAKTDAREALRAFLGGSGNADSRRAAFGGTEIIIRINALGSPWGDEDFLAARALKPDAILVPKVDEFDDLTTIADALGETDAPPSLRLWAMIETPRGVMNAGAIARHGRTAGGRLDCFVIGTNDLMKETGVLSRPGRPFLSSWLMQVVLGARAYGLDVIDGVYNDFGDEDGFIAEALEGRAMGFDGKSLIHPRQIEAANRAFGIDPAHLTEARRIIDAFALPENASKGVIAIEGRMVERLHLSIAERLVAKAAAIEDRRR